MTPSLLPFPHWCLIDKPSSTPQVSGTVSLRICAPKLPPTTSKLRPCLCSVVFSSVFSRASASMSTDLGFTCQISSRTGLPTVCTSVALPENCSLASSKPRSTRLAILLRSLLVMPAAAFCSCTITGIPKLFAATPPGPLA